MSMYTLTVLVEPDLLPWVIDQNYALCVAMAVEDETSNLHFDVVAFATSNVLLNNTITWNRNYSIAATDQAFQPGSLVPKGRSKELPIHDGQAYTLVSWSKPATVKTSSAAPPTGFELVNKVSAHAIIYLTIPSAGTSPVPIYFSPLKRPGASRFVPSHKVAVWFQQDIITSTMITLDPKFVRIADFTSQNTETILFGDEGASVNNPLGKKGFDSAIIPALK